MRLLCDEMLGRLGRWLRAAGYDTEIAPPGGDDRTLFAHAIETGRILLTRDRAMTERTGAASHVVVLRGQGAEEMARELRDRLGIDWLHAPFTRCVVDNTPLRPLSASELERLPGRARALGGPYTACPICGRLYWAGSHHRRMRARLEKWQAARPCGGT